MANDMTDKSSKLVVKLNGLSNDNVYKHELLRNIDKFEKRLPLKMFSDSLCAILANDLTGLFETADVHNKFEVKYINEILQLKDSICSLFSLSTYWDDLMRNFNYEDIKDQINIDYLMDLSYSYVVGDIINLVYKDTDDGLCSVFLINDSGMFSKMTSHNINKSLYKTVDIDEEFLNNKDFVSIKYVGNINKLSPTNLLKVGDVDVHIDLGDPKFTVDDVIYYNVKDIKFHDEFSDKEYHVNNMLEIKSEIEKLQIRRYESNLKEQENQYAR